MSLVNPSILPGFMELLPEEQKVFNRIKNTIENNFIKYGFINIDTPLIEKEEILLSKGGGETSKQIYRIDKEKTPQALRFDLTVSLARYVSMHFNELVFPFKRYQIGKVYRGERNQKGRYREFYQCDIDIVGNNSLSIYNDAQMPLVIYKIFEDLGFKDITFKTNNRKLLNGFLQSINVEDSEGVLRTIDKLAKIGKEKTFIELEKLDINKYSIEKIFDFIEEEKNNEETLSKLDSLNIDNELFVEGLGELKEVYKFMKLFGIPEENIKLDLTITRGLDYYTGTVFETFLDEYENIGSVCSGGRYDDLANNFTNNKYPGVGLSIGLTRLFYQFNEVGLLDEEKEIDDTIVVIPMNDDVLDYSIKVVNKLRENNIKSDIYLESGKMKKKFTYADRKNVNFGIIIGETEKESNQIAVRDFITGNQELVDFDDMIVYLSEVNNEN